MLRRHGIQAVTRVMVYVANAVTLWRCLQQCVLAASSWLRVHWRHQPWNDSIEYSVALNWVHHLHTSYFGPQYFGRAHPQATAPFPHFHLSVLFTKFSSSLTQKVDGEYGIQWQAIHISFDFLFSYFVMKKDGSVISQQEGVFRTNCMDCLDRTNVVQNLLARVSLQHQLEVRAVYSGRKRVSKEKLA
jgi:hypothetical protein